MTKPPLSCYYHDRGYFRAMEGAFIMYDVKTLCQLSNISQQTFYRLIRENNEFRTLVESNRQKKGSGYKYDSAVLEWLYSFYDISPDATTGEAPLENALEGAESPSNSLEAEQRINSLLEEIEGLKGQIDALTADLEKKEAERQMLFQQNAQLILLLGQEKQEKQALLPPPRKPIGERIKAFFSRKKEE